jgi:hypothetical protein
MRTILLAGLVALAARDGYEAQPLDEAAPSAVSERVRAELAPKGARVLGADKKPYVDVWLRKCVPAAAPRDLLGVKYPAIQDGTLVGVARFHAATTEFRGTKVAAGVYTLRYVVQPEDGDHQGTADSRDFLLLCPAADDASPDGMKAEDAVKLSAKVSGKKHPAVLWLVKRGEEGDKLPRLVHDEAASRWLLEAETAQGAKGEKLRLWVVVVGRAADF